MAMRTGVDAVVLIAHGPRDLTRSAERSLRRVAPAVMVVPAFPSRPGGGGEAVQAALDALPGEAVTLLVHDDVELGPATPARLAEAVRSGVAVAVPASNDQGVDHHGGTLPPASHREFEAAATGRAKRLVRVRPSCLMARASLLSDLAHQRLHDPLSVLDDVTIGFELVPGTVAHHRNTCVERLRSDLRGAEAPVLVATMIVRDEEADLDDCLGSLDGLVDRIEVCDTGSVDATVAIAERHGAHVIHREWRNDFGWARTEVLNEARDAQWALWIDADERARCEDVELLRAYLYAFADELDVLELPITNFSRDDGERSSTFAAPRLFRADRIDIDGSLHEQPVPRDDAEGALVRSSFGLLTLDHHGYRTEVVEVRDKHTRNVAVARAAYERDPRAKTALDYAKSLTFARESPELAAELYREGLAGLPEPDHRARAFVHGLFAGHLLSRLNRPAEARAEADRGLRLVPADSDCRHLFAQACVAEERLAELVRRADELAASPSLRPLAESEQSERAYLGYVSLARFDGGDVEGAWQDVVAAHRLPVPLTAEEAAYALVVAAATGRSVPAAVGELMALHRPASRRVLFEVATSTLPVDQTAELAVAMVDGPGRDPDTTVIGVLAAAVAGRGDLLERLVPAARELAPDVRDELTDRLRQRGHHDVAARLTTTPAGVAGRSNIGRDRWASGFARR